MSQGRRIVASARCIVLLLLHVDGLHVLALGRRGERLREGSGAEAIGRGGDEGGEGG